jgi:6-pyruvoyltetrahydropterin/6-carboxytetrahydropterin synthase
MTEIFLHTASAPFEAACRVGILPEGHRSRDLHGHSYVARIRAQLPVNWAEFPGAESEQLQTRLIDCLSPLDYGLLNEHIEVPTDENIARWLIQRLSQSNSSIPNLSTPNIEQMGIRSTRQQGADLDTQGNAHIWRRYRFEAAHQLPNVPKGHQCGRMHGHGFEVILHVNQNLSQTDMGIDYDHIDDCWAPIHQILDHACLNDIPGLENPTSEMLAAWIWQQLSSQLEHLSWVTVYETVTAGCHFDGKHYRIWKEQRFESAVRLQKAPKGDRRRQLHGHSYLLRLHLSAALDPVQGWTVDYGDVKSLFKPAYDALDHRPLNELSNIQDADLTSIVHWIKDQTEHVLPQLDRIDLEQTPGCGVILGWGEQSPALPS